MMEVTWKADCRTISSRVSYSVEMLMLTRTMDTRMMPRYAHSSMLRKISLNFLRSAR